jgi:four helix bundle protein
MKEVFRHENLEVWQKAIEVANAIYRVSRSFPDDERYGITSQVRRAAVSIASNIAEGSGRRTKKDFSRCIEIAYGSALETVSHLRISHDQGFLTAERYQALRGQIATLCRMLSGLKSSLDPR